MRPIDADRLKAVLEKNFGHTGGASVLEQLIDEQPTIEPSTNCSEFPNNSDTISRQAAIDVTDSEKVSTNPEHFKSSEKFIKFMDDDDIASFGRWQWANGFNTALVASKVQLEKLPSAQPEQRWIPVSERLPEESGYYITSNEYNGVGEDFYYDGHFWNADKNAYSVIAWMPKPKAYKPNK